MASHRKPRTSPLAGPAARTAATLATAAAASVVVLTQPGHADPKPTAAQVKAQVDALYQQAEQATQQYDGAVAATQTLQTQANRLQQEAAATDDQLNTLRSRLGGMAALQYRNGTLDPELQLLMSAHPDDYLQRAGDLSQALASQAGLVQEFAAQSQTLDGQRAAAQAKLSALQTEQQRLAAAKQQIQRKLAAAQQLLSSLDAATRASVTAALGGSGPSGPSGSTVQPPPDLGSVVATGRAALAVAFARAQVGKPYVWGATGPASYDCSGLVQAAWAAAGVSLPRTTYEQINAGQRIALSDLQPGDLVFYYAGVSHVAMYVGGGEIIHAPHPGASVEYAPVGEMPIVGAVRPG
ncbi:C40 family peptidase [Streptacidiphilus jiangxiensis]|uniref:Cell wall-associated hydrolase, NlpC family n=1 Tax=Streptacidiphilus jiangxiensis TaxID=235985 RepID=A0A1H7MAJ4_STRJI|nr:C40 family peptidase [Streptacidiphilus jiangxiensis]SEL08099.1 Cell wall-associated hydrolase, NlpC family [Streptacidiphilus jiangxiensis]